MELPKSITSNWLAKLDRYNLIELEEHLGTELEQWAARLAESDCGVTTAIRAKIQKSLNRHHRVCDEFVRRGDEDPRRRRLFAEAPVPTLPDLPDRLWAESLSDHELADLGDILHGVIENVEYRTPFDSAVQSSRIDRENCVSAANTKLKRMWAFLRIVEFERMRRCQQQRQEIPAARSLLVNGHEAWDFGFPTYSDYVAGKAEMRILHWATGLPGLWEFKDRFRSRMEKRNADRLADEWRSATEAGEAGTLTLVGCPAPFEADVVGGRSELGLRVLHQLTPLGDRSAAFAGIVRQVLGTMLAALVKASVIDRLNCADLTLQQLLDWYHPEGPAAETAESRLLREIFDTPLHVYPEPRLEVALSLDYAVRRAIAQSTPDVVGALVRMIQVDFPEHAGLITTAMIGFEGTKSYPLFDLPCDSRPLEDVPIVNEQHSARYSLLGKLARILYLSAYKHFDLNWTSLKYQYLRMSVTENWLSELLVVTPDGQLTFHDGWHSLRVVLPPFNCSRRFKDSDLSTPLTCVLAHLAAVPFKRNHPVVAYRARGLPLDGAFLSLCASAWRFVRLLCNADSESRSTQKSIRELAETERTLWKVLTSSRKRPVSDVLNWLGGREQQGLLGIEERLLFVGTLETSRPLMILAPCPREI